MYPANPQNLVRPARVTVLGYRLENKIQRSRQRSHLSLRNASLVLSEQGWLCPIASFYLTGCCDRPYDFSAFWGLSGDSISLPPSHHGTNHVSSPLSASAKAALERYSALAGVTWSGFDTGNRHFEVFSPLPYHTSAHPDTSNWAAASGAEDPA